MATLATSAETSLLSRVAGMLFHPRREWQAVAREDSDTRQIFWRYALPLILLGPLAGLASSVLFRPHFLWLPLHISAVQAVSGVVIGTVLMAVTFLILVMLADSLAVRMGSEATFTQSFKLVTYCTTPTWLILGLVAAMPPLRFLLVGVLWSTWLTYVGAGPVMGLTGSRAVRYVALLFAAAAALYATAAFLTLVQFQMLQQMGLLP